MTDEPDIPPTAVARLGKAAVNFGWLAVVLWSAYYLYGIVSLVIANGEYSFVDARLYYRATATWLSGGDPWAVSVGGIGFGAIPPTLLLNVPFIPFGEGAAVIFWPVAGLVGMGLALRRLKLSIWWLAWPPFMEGWIAGSPDMALLAIGVFGAGAVAAVTKPYSLPWLIADRRWYAIATGLMVALATLPILPWALFLSEFSAISTTLESQSRHLSAWGAPILMVLTGTAVLTLPRREWSLATPGLWPATQLHYAGFAVQVAAKSPILAFGLAIPIAGVIPVSILAYAVWCRLSPARRSTREAHRAFAASHVDG